MITLLGALALVTAPSPARASGAPSHAQAIDTLRVLLIVDDTVARASLLRGARLGAEEASHTGALFGMAVTLRVESAASPSGVQRASDSASARSPRPSLVVVAGDAGRCSLAMSHSARDSVPVLNAGCAGVDSAVASTVYSLVPAQAAAGGTDSTRLELWHWSNEKFGGEQLNQRFTRRFTARMDSPAWTGWMAMKIALDAALHAKSTDGAALLRQLAEPRAQYDGQKGRPLRFDRGTHRLVQPVYRVAGSGDSERVVAEVGP